MKYKCFNVEVIEYTDKNNNRRKLYKVWFNLPDGVCWLLTNFECKAGDEIFIRLKPMSTNDVKTNMRMGVSIG